MIVWSGCMVMWPWGQKKLLLKQATFFFLFILQELAISWGKGNMYSGACATVKEGRARWREVKGFSMWSTGQICQQVVISTTYVPHEHGSVIVVVMCRVAITAWICLFGTANQRWLSKKCCTEQELDGCPGVMARLWLEEHHDTSPSGKRSVSRHMRNGSWLFHIHIFNLSWVFSVFLSGDCTQYCSVSSTTSLLPWHPIHPTLRCNVVVAVTSNWSC